MPGNSAPAETLDQNLLSTLVRALIQDLPSLLVNSSQMWTRSVPTPEQRGALGDTLQQVHQRLRNAHDVRAPLFAIAARRPGFPDLAAMILAPRQQNWVDVARRFSIDCVVRVESVLRCPSAIETVLPVVQRLVDKPSFERVVQSRLRARPVEELEFVQQQVLRAALLAADEYIVVPDAPVVAMLTVGVPRDLAVLCLQGDAPCDSELLKGTGSACELHRVGAEQVGDLADVVAAVDRADVVEKSWQATRLAAQLMCPAS